MDYERGIDGFPPRSTGVFLRAGVVEAISAGAPALIAGTAFLCGVAILARPAAENDPLIVVIIG